MVVPYKTLNIYTMKNLVIWYRVTLSLIALLGVISLAYFALVVLSFIALLDGGGTCDLLESIKITWVPVTVVISIVCLSFLKKTRHRLKLIASELGEQLFA